MKLPKRVRAWLVDRAFATMLERDPDFVIGDPAEPYMKRWHLVGPNRLLSVYVHCILRDDDDRALHDHRSATLSLILSGDYREVVPESWEKWKLFGYRDTRTLQRKSGDVVFRRAAAPHRLEMGESKAVVTIFVTGPTWRTWGFWLKDGWVPHFEYTDPQNPGMVKA